jgi:hypothetical protein
VAGDGTVSRVTGRATVHGTVTCSEPVTVNLNGTLTQVVKKTILSGPLGTQVACTPGAPVTWQAVAIPNGTTPFGQGNAEAEVTASAQDPNFGGRHRHRDPGGAAAPRPSHLGEQAAVVFLDWPWPALISILAELRGRDAHHQGANPSRVPSPVATTTRPEVTTGAEARRSLALAQSSLPEVRSTATSRSRVAT